MVGFDEPSGYIHSGNDDGHDRYITLLLLFPFSITTALAFISIIHAIFFISKGSTAYPLFSTAVLSP